MEQAVRAWVERDAAGYGYLTDFYRRGAEVRWLDERGIVLRNERYRITYVGGEVSETLEVLHGPGLVLTENERLTAALMKAHPDWDLGVFTQAYYLKPTPPELAPRPGLSFRPLNQEDADFVLANYHNPGAYEKHIRERIAEGMLGGMVDGELAGFVGIHQEGAIGMLEVLPAFRRRGLAEALEREIISAQLERGCFPYCHIRLGNQASVALQEKLGLTFDRSRRFYWLG